MKKMLSAIAAAALIAVGGVSAGAPAAAAPVPVASDEETTEAGEITPEAYAELIDALQSDGATVDSDGVLSYDVEGFGPIELPVAAEDDGTIRPLLSVGGGVTSPYVSFNRTDQAAIIAGGGAGFAAAICAIPAAGWAACGAAAAIAAAATVYLTEYGRCPTSAPNLRIYVYGGTDGCYR